MKKQHHQSYTVEQPVEGVLWCYGAKENLISHFWETGRPKDIFCVDCFIDALKHHGYNHF